VSPSTIRQPGGGRKGYLLEDFAVPLNGTPLSPKPTSSNNDTSTRAAMSPFFKA
jgi:hypothetical protein